MKYLQWPGICLIVCVLTLSATAQNSVPVNEPDLRKPKLFTNLPDKFPVETAVLRSLVATGTGKDILLNCSAGKEFRGRVISRADDSQVTSVVIRSGNFNGATLTLSSSTQPDGAVKFTGRIISFHHGDMYELQNQNDQYIFIRRNYYDVINE